MVWRHANIAAAAAGVYSEDGGGCFTELEYITHFACSYLAGVYLTSFMEMLTWLSVFCATALVGAVLCLSWWRGSRPGTLEQWCWEGVDRVLFRDGALNIFVSVDVSIRQSLSSTPSKR
jgi:hypothetical protein